MTLEARHAILDALLEVLDLEHAEGLIDHRKRKKAPLTALATKILLKQLRLCPNANEAVEEMINRNWTGLKAEWVQKSSRASPPAGKRLNAVEANLSLRAMNHEPASQRRDFVDAECFPTDRSGLPSPAADAGQAFGWDQRYRHH